MRYLFVDGKDRTDGDKAVDVGGTVERVETHYVFTLQKGNNDNRAYLIQTVLTASGEENRAYVGRGIITLRIASNSQVAKNQRWSTSFSRLRSPCCLGPR